jgi:diaminohydroxyphosphoribosylaminopyrimidine deaminase/5-amino-6-(5-phosphoribosylamino)uracil reductase
VAGRRAQLLVPEHNGHLDLVVLMMLLGKQQVNSIWVEAGPTLAGALLQAGLVDELIVYIAPKLLGNAARGLCVLPGLEKLADAPISNSMRYVRLARMSACI